MFGLFRRRSEARVTPHDLYGAAARVQFQPARGSQANLPVASTRVRAIAALLEAERYDDCIAEATLAIAQLPVTASACYVLIGAASYRLARFADAIAHYAMAAAAGAWPELVRGSLDEVRATARIPASVANAELVVAALVAHNMRTHDGDAEWRLLARMVATDWLFERGLPQLAVELLVEARELAPETLWIERNLVHARAALGDRAAAAVAAELPSVELPAYLRDELEHVIVDAEATTRARYADALAL